MSDARHLSISAGDLILTESFDGFDFLVVGLVTDHDVTSIEAISLPRRPSTLNVMRQVSLSYKIVSIFIDGGRWALVKAS